LIDTTQVNTCFSSGKVQKRADKSFDFYLFSSVNIVFLFIYFFARLGTVKPPPGESNNIASLTSEITGMVSEWGKVSKGGTK